MSEPSSQPSTRPAWRAAQTRDWPGYFDAVEGKPPRDTLLGALDAFEADRPDDSPSRSPPMAVDLGCGEGRDTAELLRRGWRVVAVDGHPDAIRRLVSRPDVVPTPSLEIRYCELEDASIPAARLINASFALPFCRPDAFDALWARLRAAIEPGGRFAGQLFGDRDSWAALPDRSHHSRAAALALLEGLQLERFDEEERDGTDAAGAGKHWHVFHIVARRPATTETR